MLFFVWSLVLSAVNYARKQKIASILSKHYLSPVAYHKTIHFKRHKDFNTKSYTSETSTNHEENVSSFSDDDKEDVLTIDNRDDTTFTNNTPSFERIEALLKKDTKDINSPSQCSSIQTLGRTSRCNSTMEKALSEQLLNRWDDDENILYTKDNIEIIAQLDPYKLYEKEWKVTDKKDNIISLLKNCIASSVPTCMFIAHLHPVSHSNMDLLKKVFGDAVEAGTSPRVEETMTNALPPLDLNAEIIYNLAPLLLDNFCKRIAVKRTNSNDVIFKCNLETFYNIIYYWSESALYSAADLAFVDTITCISPSNIEILSEVDHEDSLILQPSSLSNKNIHPSSLSSSLASLNNSFSQQNTNNGDLPLLELLYLLDQQNTSSKDTSYKEKTATLPTKFSRRHYNSECLSDKQHFFSDLGLYKDISEELNSKMNMAINDKHFLEEDNYYAKNSAIMQASSSSCPWGSLRSLRASSNNSNKVASMHRPPLPSSIPTNIKNIETINEKKTFNTINNSSSKFTIPHNLLWSHTSRFPYYNKTIYNLMSDSSNLPNNHIRSLRSISATGHLEKDYNSTKSRKEYYLETSHHINYSPNLPSPDKELVLEDTLSKYPFKFRNRSYSESKNNLENSKSKDVSTSLNGKLATSLEHEKLIGHFNTKYPFPETYHLNTIEREVPSSFITRTPFERYKRSLRQIKSRKSHSCLPDNRGLISLEDLRESQDILTQNNIEILQKYFKNMFSEKHLNQIETFEDNDSMNKKNNSKLLLNIPTDDEGPSRQLSYVMAQLSLGPKLKHVNERRGSMNSRLFGANGSSITDFINNQLPPIFSKPTFRRYSCVPIKKSCDYETPLNTSRTSDSLKNKKVSFKYDGGHKIVCTPSSSLSHINSKPPTILVFTGKDYKLFFKVQETVEKLVAVDYYTIHQLSFDKLKEDEWMVPGTALLIICDTYSLDSDCWAKLQIYFSNTGRVIFLCQNSILDNFKCTKKWANKDSWIKKLFGTRKSSKSMNKDFNNFLKKCHKHFKHNEDINEKFNAFDLACGTNYSVHFKKEKNAPLLLFLESSANNAVALFSDASTEEIITSRYLDDVKEILKKTGIKMNTVKELTNDMKILTNGNLVLKNITELNNFKGFSYFEDKGNNPIINFYPQHYNYQKIRKSNKYFQSIQLSFKGAMLRDFDTGEYFKQLATSTLGHRMIHIDTCESVMKISNSLTQAMTTCDGTVVIANTQKYGRGNGDNQWISPRGCATFAFDFNIPIESHLGSKIAFLQHILSLSIIESIKTLTDIPDFPIQIKWPNGIYYDKKIKIGGVKLKCSIYGNVYKCVIGGAVNVANSKPTTCINDLLPETDEPKLSVATVIGEILNRFENNSKLFERHGCEKFIERYISFWMHDNEEILIDIDETSEKKVLCIVTGMDKEGFLVAREKNNNKRYFRIYETGRNYENMKGRLKESTNK
uniref:BPL/LPL catalytic domain-containing protein n=1 Tax=Parastrongyloides trichosuri TaxID=131310 RepID=A0A0N4Z040_PARTI